MTIDDLITDPTSVSRAVACALLFLAGVGLASLAAHITQLLV